MLLCLVKYVSSKLKILIYKHQKLLSGQATITTLPANATIKVNQNITINCDSGSVSILPSLLINGDSTDLNPQVDDITLSGTPDRMKTYLFISATRNNNQLNFICTGVSNSDPVTLNVLCKLSVKIDYNIYVSNLVNPEILNITDGAGLEEQSATITFIVDANPQIVASDVSVSLSNTPNVQINGDNVTLTFSNLVRSNAGEHTVTVTNSEGSDNENFQLSVYCK